MTVRTWAEWGEMSVPSSMELQWPAMSPENLEREYSPSSAIGGNYQPYIDAYIVKSEEARAACDNIITCRYGPEQSNTIDLVLPADIATDKSHPLLVFFHGGYWQELSKNESLFAAPDCIAQGIAYAAVDYTLAPTASLGQIVAECRQALRWLHEAAAEYGYDPKQIIVSGSSAGAHLAAMCALPKWDGKREWPDYLPAAAILVSGIFELEPLVSTSVNDALGLDKIEAQAQSPLLKDLRQFPPSLIACGRNETDEFIRQSYVFANALSAAQTPVRAVVAENRNHFDVILDLTNTATPLGQQVRELMQILGTIDA